MYNAQSKTTTPAVVVRSDNTPGRPGFAMRSGIHCDGTGGTARHTYNPAEQDQEKADTDVEQHSTQNRRPRSHTEQVEDALRRNHVMMSCATVHGQIRQNF